MKLSWGFIGLSLHFAEAATSSSNQAAHIYLSQSAPLKGSTQDNHVSPTTARLILAQRLGLSRFHSLKDADEQSLAQINEFSGEQSLFNQNEEATLNHLVVVIEGVETPEDLIKLPSHQELLFTESPPTEANTQLLEDLSAQAHYLFPSKSSGRVAAGYSAIIETLKPMMSLGKETTIKGNNNVVLVHIQSLLNKSGSSYIDTSKIIRESLIRLANKDHSSAIFITMPKTALHKQKRAASPYGTYDLPSSLSHRAAESPIDPIGDRPAADGGRAPQSAADQGPLRGILKSCYSSQKDCEEATRNCSGRGECTPKFGEPKEKDADVANCYSCKCKPEVVKHAGGGIKTTVYGGPACQKKDISTPFWLFVTFTVVLVFLVSSGVGMLYSMGNEELPSVIGAGVSGPKAK